VNEIKIAGHFDREPYVQTIERQSGPLDLTRVSLNFTSKRGDKEVNMWIDVEAVGDKARDLAIIPQNVPVTITGRLERAAWQDKNSGEWKSKHFIKFQSAEYDGAGATSDPLDDLPF